MSLLDKKVQRGNRTDPAKTLNEWLPAESQLTLDGVSAFWKRQQERIARVQANKTEATQKVRKLQ